MAFALLSPEPDMEQHKGLIRGHIYVYICLGLPQFEGALLGVPITIRIQIFWGLIRGSTYLWKQHETTVSALFQGDLRQEAVYCVA